eukprot:XP_005618796.1 protein FAM53A [Canis lupus familiaris]
MENGQEVRQKPGASPEEPRTDRTVPKGRSRPRKVCSPPGTRERRPGAAPGSGSDTESHVPVTGCAPSRPSVRPGVGNPKRPFAPAVAAPPPRRRPPPPASAARYPDVTSPAGRAHGGRGFGPGWGLAAHAQSCRPTRMRDPERADGGRSCGRGVERPLPRPHAGPAPARGAEGTAGRRPADGRAAAAAGAEERGRWGRGAGPVAFRAAEALGFSPGERGLWGWRLPRCPRPAVAAAARPPSAFWQDTEQQWPCVPFESNEDRCPWKVLSGGWPIGNQTATGTWGPNTVLGAVSTIDLKESSGPPSAPPTKRHCRSLSELAHCHSLWRPSCSRVWTPVSKRWCHSGGNATLQESLGASLPRGAAPLDRTLLVAGPTSPPAPQPSSASGGCMDSCEGSSGLPRRPRVPSWRHRLSLSQEHLAEVGTALPSTSSSPSSTPELDRRLGLLRCCSQPCVLVGRKWQRKRRREEGTRWPRPSLDFLKMTQTLKNSKSLCSLDYEDEEEDDAQVKLTPYDPHGLTGIVTPGSNPLRVCPRPCCPSPWASGEPMAAEGEGGSSGDPSDWDSAGEEGIFPPSRGELDLGQIENN